MKRTIFFLLFLCLMAWNDFVSGEDYYIDTSAPKSSGVLWQPIPTGWITFDAVGITLNSQELEGLTDDELKNLSVFINLVRMNGVNHWHPDIQKKWFKTLLPRIYEEKLNERN